MAIGNTYVFGTFTYYTAVPENDDFEIGQWCISTERKEPIMFQVDSMSADWLFDATRRQFDPDYCEVILNK